MWHPIKFPSVFRSAHIVLLNQAIQAGTRGVLCCLTSQCWCRYSDGRAGSQDLLYLELIHLNVKWDHAWVKWCLMLFEVAWVNAENLLPRCQVIVICSFGRYWIVFSVSVKRTDLYLTFKCQVICKFGLLPFSLYLSIDCCLLTQFLCLFWRCSLSQVFLEIDLTISRGFPGENMGWR